MKPKVGTYLHVCFPKGGGRSQAGELHHTKDLARGARKSLERERSL